MTAESHYNESYFQQRYSRILNDPTYHHLLATFWKKQIFDPLVEFGLTKESHILDYGAGTGVVSAAMPNTMCFDTSLWSLDFLKRSGRSVIDSTIELKTRTYDAILCSHSLEHYENPFQTLIDFYSFVSADGYLILVLPVETDFTVRLDPDLDQHLQAWTFQSIANLLRRTGWIPQYGRLIYGPLGLGFMSRFCSKDVAVSAASLAGSWKAWFPSMLILAKRATNLAD
jgi:2-polyprenyl-3-methyl-5-hydroxy-6-metoxy-1,4-benzoquinol methylase